MPGESFRFGPSLVDRHGYRVTRRLHHFGSGWAELA
jgi:hypothetical protein